MGGNPFVSRWISVPQATIDAFADLTQDHQWIHTDARRAATETPFGGTIAHGFLTLALLAPMAYDALPGVEGAQMGVNYGLNRLRFLAPVRAGGRIRGRFAVDAIEERNPGELTFTWSVTVEIEGSDRPAFVAEWINRYYIA